jgi:preprotein translocase subunit SecA
MFGFFSKLFDSNEKQLNKHWPQVREMNKLEEAVKKLSDEELAGKTEELRKRLDIDITNARKERDPFENPPTAEEIAKELQQEQENLFSVMNEVYALVREASNRKVVHRHYDVQMLAGIFLAHGYVIEHFTGEGKTLVATLPLFLYGLMGKGAHLVTVNEYLARRDAEWCGHIYNALGMSVGVITPGASYKYIDDERAIELKGDEAKDHIRKRSQIIEEEGRLLMSSMEGVNLIQCSKKEAYECDIVYGTNNEFGFDYLRDNMAKSLDQRVQGPLYYGIVDECDSILIDEARTPLIISSPAQKSNELYKKFADLAKRLDDNTDYVVDEKAHSVSLNEEGVDKVENLLGVDNIWENYEYVHHLDNALKAKELYQKDDQYIIKDGRVMIVDEFTGRVLPGRRYSEGLHQAVEAKEGVEIKKESKTLATITFQNFFRLYDFLGGMTATALTEAEEFADIYDLEVVVIPTNLPVIRKDYSDKVFRTIEGKFRAVIEEIKEMHEKGRPVLVGTTSVENSEILSQMLKKEGIQHNVLNAKRHEKEAKIVAKAGQKGQVTIATNMAGRGTDIALGEGVKELGGLHVIGTERHESRRIDNQLRGRSGRQGDPGSSRFFVSFEDDLMRLFGGNTMSSIMSQVGMDDSTPIEAGLIGRTIESAQKRVENYHFDTRKHLVQYDDVLNQQREIIYDLRLKILTILEREKDRISQDPEGVDFDFDVINKRLITELEQEIQDFSIKDPGTWDLNQVDSEKLTRPLRAWILKMAFEQANFLVTAQMQDDMEVDDLEERKILTEFTNIVPQELAETVIEEIDYSDLSEFENEFYKVNDPQEQKVLLHQMLFIAYVYHVDNIGDKAMRELERSLVLQTIDNLWMDHLDAMTDLRHGIGLRGYAQKNPLVEYKNEGFTMFDRMLAQMKDIITKRFFKVKVVEKKPAIDMKAVQAVKETVSESMQTPQKSKSNSKLAPSKKPTNTQKGQFVDKRPGNVSKTKTVVKNEKVGRNDPCPCGSGRKYKKCCYPQYE